MSGHEPPCAHDRVTRSACRAGPVDLTAIETDAAPGFDGGKKKGKAALFALGDELSDLQERLFAEGTSGSARRVLLVLQGMDTSGKGGVLRHTVGLVDPQGVRITSFKAPTEEELRPRLPVADPQGAARAPGYIGVFDRSHYEDVLIARVRELAPSRARSSAATTRSTTSRPSWSTTAPRSSSACCTSRADEQKERLLARLDDPTKHWKFNPGDIDERAHVAGATARPTRSPSSAPTPSSRRGTSIPSDKKWYRNLAIGQLLLETLRGLDPQWPAADFDVEARAQAAARRGAARVIPTVAVTRYVTPLREGGSLPGIVEADDLGTYVCKFRGAGQGAAGAGRRGGRRRAGPPDRPAHARGWSRSTWTRRSPATRPTRRSRTCSTPAPGSTSASTSCPARSATTATLAAGRRRGRAGAVARRLHAPTSTAPGATPTCCSGTATSG